MKKRRNTQKALLGSLTMMLLCFALLLGTTFAWFSDTVSSSSATIKTGNLDVELEYAVQPGSGEKLTWRSATDNTTDLFGSDTLWEPGFTGVVYLRVKNTGSLAMKYKYTVDVTDNTLGKTSGNPGKLIDLTNYIKLTAVESSVPATDDCLPLYTSRADAKAVVESTGFIYGTPPAEGATEGWTGTAFTSPSDGNLQKGEKSNIIAVVVHMPLAVGNEANNNGNDVPSISLKVNLVATQDTAESDSFSNGYDSGATYPTVNQTQNQSEENQT